MRGAAGLASIITAHYASRSTDSWSPKGRRFPPQDLVAPLDSKCLPYPVVTDPRRRRCGRNVTSPTRSRPSTAEWFTRSLRLCCPDVRCVRAISREIRAEICDAVKLSRVTPSFRRDPFARGVLFDPWRNDNLPSIEIGKDHRLRESPI